jgi:hypothetical protein
MACGDPIPPDRVIYRAVSGRHFDRKSNSPRETLFLLKGAHDNFEAETYLSFGVDIEGARAGLQNIARVCEIRVEDILALGHNLQVVEDEDPQKIRVSGMPLPTVNEELAFTIAKDLRRKSRICS